MKRNHILGGVVLAMVLVNLVSHYFFFRFDLTEDKRFTLSKASKDVVSKFNSPVIVDILLEGRLSGEFARLRQETVLLLEQFRARNPSIVYHLVNPLEDGATRDETIADLQRLGLKPASVVVEEEGKTTQELLFPWAMVNHNNKTVKVPLLKNKLGDDMQSRINNSMQNLEYAFADAFKKLQLTEKKKIAVLRGNGELGDAYLADFLTALKEYYNIGAITLDSVEGDPNKVLAALSKFDMALVAKPQRPFTEMEKYVLDQYIVGGGRSLWLMDQVNAELDSLLNEQGSAIALKRELNLDDFFFKYGLRLNPSLVNDLYNTPIVLANGQGNDSQYNPLPWVYHPMVFPKNDHSITSNIAPLRLQFAGTMDTLASTAYKKTILLRSSPLSKTEGVPKAIDLSQAYSAPQREDYPPNEGFPLAVLLEGSFASAYLNRVKPVGITNALEKGPENKMIVVADGDVVKNQLQRGQPLELGYDKWTNTFYGNKDFLLNCVHYLLDDDGFINIRTKTVGIPLLDGKKIARDRTFWQLITVAGPILLVLGGYWGLSYMRRRKFAA